MKPVLNSKMLAWRDLIIFTIIRMNWLRSSLSLLRLLAKLFRNPILLEYIVVISDLIQDGSSV